MSLQRIFAIVFKEFIHIKRDKPTLGIIFAFPVVMLLLFGYAASTDVDKMPTVVLNQDNKQKSREILEKFEQSTYFKISNYVKNTQELRYLVDSGKAKIGFIIPPDYSKNISRGVPAQVQIILDGSDPSIARTALFTASSIAQNYGSEIFIEKLKSKGSFTKISLPIDLRARVWYNPDMKSINFNIPGLIGLILQNVTVMLTAFALVRERDKGTLEQLIVTPVKPLELIIGKLIPYILVAFIAVTLSLLIATLWFKVKIVGSLAELLVLSSVFLVGALGMGLFVSTIARNQLQAMQIAFAIILPSVILSGFMFPREAMSGITYYLGYLIPLTYFLQILRGVILKGIGFEYLWKDVTLLVIFGISALFLSAKRFNKTLD
ncbi:MAG: ABC transporter permease [Candidatus Sericytochromatia bacterium]